MLLLPSFVALAALLDAALALPAGATLRSLPGGGDAPTSHAAMRRQLQNVSDPLPAGDRSYFQQGTPTAVAASLVERIQVGANLASAMYCPSVQAGAWTCGAPCAAAGEVEVLYTSGDGDLDPHQNVLWLEDEKAVAVTVSFVKGGGGRGAGKAYR